ncbi:iron ABC transporter ATP-binding protein, partial [archaeon]
MKVIEVEDLHFSYDGITEVLKGINLVIEEGEIVAIMGENGAG